MALTEWTRGRGGSSYNDPMKKRTWAMVGLVVATAVAGGVWWGQKQGAAAPAYRTGVVERGALQATVSASGSVNPVTQVSVGSQISGQLQEVFVDFNSEVRAGQLIAQIDPATYEYRLRSAEADLDAARASVLTAQANAAAAQANVSRARTDLAEAERVHARNLQLVAQGFIAQSEADRTRAAQASAQEALRSAQAQVGVTEAQIKSAQAAVAQREAQVASARVDLGRTRIVSPVSGIVIKRAVERGQTVAASLQAPELFVIAQNLSDMQVDAAIDEADVGRIRTGQKASFTVDAFPGQTFEGEVRQVRKAAQNVSNVVTYVAVIGFSNLGGRLLPGMTANVRIITDAREDALKLPNAALRVRLPGVEPAAASASGAPGASAPNTAASAGAPAGRSPLTEFRERLVSELQPTPEQLAAFDAQLEAARPRFMALRELPEAERPRARERILAELRAAIGERLDAAQRPRYAALLAELAGRQTGRGRVFTLGADGKPVAHDVRLGISDGTSTELILSPGAPAAAVLVPGAQVITGLPGGVAAPARPATGGPRMPF